MLVDEQNEAKTDEFSRFHHMVFLLWFFQPEILQRWSHTLKRRKVLFLGKKKRTKKEKGATISFHRCMLQHFDYRICCWLKFDSNCNPDTWLLIVFSLLTLQPHFFISEIFTEVKVVVVFDALMSGLPTHKEEFIGYYLWT